MLGRSTARSVGLLGGVRVHGLRWLVALVRAGSTLIVVRLKKRFCDVAGNAERCVSVQHAVNRSQLLLCY